MKIKIIWPGKTKEQFIREGIEKYQVLLRHYADISMIELREEKGKDAGKTAAAEGERILKLKVPFSLLDERGRSMTSVQFGEYVASQAPSLNFVLGGAYGVSDEVRKAARSTLSLSKMTFTHEMARLFFLEQLFRAFTIQHKKGYHH